MYVLPVIDLIVAVRPDGCCRSRLGVRTYFQASLPAPYTRYTSKITDQGTRQVKDIVGYVTFLVLSFVCNPVRSRDAFFNPSAIECASVFAGGVALGGKATQLYSSVEIDARERTWFSVRTGRGRTAA